MTHDFTLSGHLGSVAQDRQYASYYSAIASRGSADNATNVVVHTLRPEVGQGSIEVTQLHSGLRVLRYDVSFADDHCIRYAFPEDRFELEACLDGGLRIVEDASGRGDLGSYTASLTPPRPTSGVVIHPAGQRYRGISLTGRRDALAPHLGSVGPDALATSLARLDRAGGDDLYMGRGTRLTDVTRALAGLYGLRADSPGSTLLVESTVMSALALLIDAGPGDNGRTVDGADLADHEIDALHRIPAILWRERHDLPTLAAIARRVSMSPKRLTTGYKTLFGVPPMEHHRRACHEHAERLLRDTDWTVDRIGSEVGYASASNFVYAFRRRTGATPAAYRRRRRPS